MRALALALLLLCGNAWAVTVIHRTIGWNVNICVANTPLSPSFATFYVAEESHLEIYAHVGLRHRGNYPVGVGWGLRAGIRGPFATEQETAVGVGVNINAPSWIKGAKTGGNIISYDQHYADAVLTGYMRLKPGWYRVELWANGHGATNGPVLRWSDSVVEVNAAGGYDDPYNSITYKLTPVE